MKNFKLVISLFLLLSLSQYIVNGQSIAYPTTQDQALDQIFGNWPEVYFSFQLTDRDDIHTLTRLISIDNVKWGEVRGYANKKEFSEFLKLGIDYIILQHPSTINKDECVENPDVKQPLVWDVYPTYSAYETMMYAFETSHP